MSWIEGILTVLVLLFTAFSHVTSQPDPFQSFQISQEKPVRQKVSLKDVFYLPSSSANKPKSQNYNPVDSNTLELAGLTKEQIMELLAAASDPVNGRQQEAVNREDQQAIHLPVRRSVKTPQQPPPAILKHITDIRSVTAKGKNPQPPPTIRKHKTDLKKYSDSAEAGLQSNDLESTRPAKGSAKDLTSNNLDLTKDQTSNNVDLTKDLEGLVDLHRHDLAGLTKDQVMDLISSLSLDSMERSQHSEFDGEHPAESRFHGGDGEFSKTCGIAMRAAEEAKAASQAQNSAGLQAAREVKLQLAEKAQRAANAAQAALSEKQNEMHMLEDQMHDAETVLLEERDSLNQTRQNVDTAAKTVESAREQYKALELALKLSKETVASAVELSQGADHELNEKVKLMSAAKNKVSELERELERAKKEYANTRESAVRAAEAAREAQMNANHNGDS